MLTNSATGLRRRSFREERERVSLRLPGVSNREWDRPEATASRSLAKAVDEIITHPTPATSPTSAEFLRPQPLGQPPVRSSEQEKLNVAPPHKTFGNSDMIQLF